MKFLQKSGFVCLFLWLAGTLTLCAQRSAAIDNFVRSGNLKHAGIGIKVLDLSTGKTVASYNEKLSLVPASTLKLVTTASALELLGENYLFQTTLLSDGKINSQGELSGNLYIQGAGDPTLGSEYLGDDKESFLKEWLDAIRKAGIRSVSGNVVVLDNLFGYEGVSPQWTWEDLGNYYAAGAYGISVFDNTYRLFLRSGAAGSQPSILRTEPAMRDIKFENHLKAAANQLDSAYIYGIPFSNDRRIYGTIPQNQPSFVIKGDIPDPGLFLAVYFTDFLRKNGVVVGREPGSFRLSQQTPRQPDKLAVTYSKPMPDIIRVINVRSNNHYAEHLFRTIMQVQKNSLPDYWNSKGLGAGGLFMQDGCGLSPANAVSSGFLVDILAYMNQKSKASDAYFRSLPLAGREGTVASFLKDTSLAGKARIKSGSIRDVQSYAGYVETGGKQYAFAVIVNHYTGKRSTLKTQIEQLLVNLFGNP